MGFHWPILGWKDTDLGVLLVIVQFTKLSEWWVVDSKSSEIIVTNSRLRSDNPVHFPRGV